MIIGPGVNICNECIELCHSLLDEEGKAPAQAPRRGKAAPAHAAPQDINILTPAEIKEGLDQYVIGQDNAKVVLAVSVYNHYKRILNMEKTDVDLQKSNVLLLGPSGVGKTLLAQTLARMLNVPFAIADATTLTEAGYVGEDVENILLKLIQAADFDIERAERGIIYIDEIDKITRKSENPSITRDVGLIPELVGRIPVVTVLDPLDEDALVRVLKEPKNSLVKQYQTLMKLDSVELDITDEALHAIAKKTIALKSGARGLRSVMEQSLIGIMYEIPSDPTIIKVTVDEETVNGAKPKLEYGAVRKRYKALASGRVN